jgi:hypothetical protein
VLHRLVTTGQVVFFPGCEYLGDRAFGSRETGERYEVPPQCRIVDAAYLSPDIPAEEPPPFAVDGAVVVPVNDVAAMEHRFQQYVVVGSGKTATDAIVRLLADGLDPDAVCWVRPRDPWMLSRAHIQPDPETYLDMVAHLLCCAAEASSLDDAFLRLEETGIMLRVDRSVTPTMAKTPTLGTWELDLLRSIGNVVRLGHVTTVRRGRIDLDDGSVRVADDSVIGNCAADGLKTRARVPIWRPEVTPRSPSGPLPVLRRRDGRLRRGDPPWRRGEEPRVPPVLLRQRRGRLGGDERRRDAQHRRVQRRAGPRGVREPDRPQPCSGSAGAPRLGCAGGRASPDPVDSGPGLANLAAWAGLEGPVPRDNPLSAY